MPNSGHVVALYIKPEKYAPLIDLADNGLALQAGLGIQGDVNGQPMSPRQVLVTRWEDLQYFNVQPGDLRENIVIAGLTEQEHQPGTVLTFGSGAKIRLTFHCEPCKRIGHLVTLDEIRNKRGILGVVLQSGGVDVGDRVSSQVNKFPSLSDIPYERFLAFVKQVPSGQVVTYRDVVVGMGVAESFFRAIPNYLRRTSSDIYPIHRVLDTKGLLISEYVPNQAEKLQSEGVHIVAGGNNQINPMVNLAQYTWSDHTLFFK